MTDVSNDVTLMGDEKNIFGILGNGWWRTMRTMGIVLKQWKFQNGSIELKIGTDTK